MSSNTDPVLISMYQIDSDGAPGMTSSDQKIFPAEEPVLSFHSISYQVKVKSGFLFGRETIEEQKLLNVNGIMTPGLNAIMGPLGGGYSLLLDVLASRKDPHGLSGNVYVHGVPHADDFQCITGYVVQDDVLMSTLTVRENLQFSAALRLPTTMSNYEKSKRINNIIKELDLDEVAESKVVSKAERKMTSIGMELILEPSILLLDEPTTGLDWRTANEVFRLLKRISEKGRIIIFSIHQPPYSIFKLFDSLTFLASGKLMYHGPAQEALEYFKSAGFRDETYYNPADFFLGVIHGVLSSDLADHEAMTTEVPLKKEESVIKTLAENYAKSSLCTDTKTTLHQLSNDQSKRSLVVKEITFVTSLRHQLIGITRRSFQNLVGQPWPLIAQVTAEFFRGLVVGATFLWLKNDCMEVQNRSGMLFFLMAYHCFSTLRTMQLFAEQKKLFLHEYISGYYRVSSYFFGTLLSDLLLRRFLSSFVFISTLYFIVGSKPSMDAFLIMIFTLTMVAFSSISMALAIAAGHSDLFIAIRVKDIYFVFTMILSSVSFYVGTITPQLSWLQYFSIPYYGFMALQHNEFLGQNFCPELNTTQSNGCPNYVICSGEEYLTMKDIDLSPWGLWKNHVALASLMIIFLIIAYGRLLYLKKHS